MTTATLTAAPTITWGSEAMKALWGAMGGWAPPPPPKTRLANPKRVRYQGATLVNAVKKG